jgi:GT2 family glycosyltransferase
VEKSIVTSMSEHKPSISVIVLSYDRPECLCRALDSITRQSYDNLEILVVDNKSESSDRIREIVCNYPEFKLIQNSSNLGFSGGMNEGVANASGDYVYLTLDDVALEENCLLNLAEYLETDLASGLVAPILCSENGDTIVSAGGEFKLTPVLQVKFLGMGERETGQFPQPFQVNWIPGAAMFCRRSFLNGLNGFRRDFFMYSEDIELCARVRKLGYKLTVVPAAKVFVGEAPHPSLNHQIVFHKIKNLLSLYLLHARLFVIPAAFFRYGIVDLCRSLRADKKTFWPRVKALSWLLVKAPSLLSERYRGVSFQP